MSISLLIALVVLWCAILLVLIIGELGYIHPSVTRQLYNLVSRAYDQKWQRHPRRYLDQELNERLFIAPILATLENTSSQTVADLGCGTGRISLMLLKDRRFKGSIEALDFSPGMVNQLSAAVKELPRESASRITIALGDLSSWCSDASLARYGAIVLLEVSEFLPKFDKLVAELARALEPGGLLMLTKPRDVWARLLIGRSLTEAKLSRLLKRNGFSKITTQPWTSRYEVVWAYK